MMGRIRVKRGERAFGLGNALSETGEGRKTFESNGRTQSACGNSPRRTLCVPLGSSPYRPDRSPRRWSTRQVTSISLGRLLPAMSSRRPVLRSPRPEGERSVPTGSDCSTPPSSRRDYLSAASRRVGAEDSNRRAASIRAAISASLGRFSWYSRVSTRFARLPRA